MFYLITMLTAFAGGLTPILKKNYVSNTRNVRSGGDIYLLVNITAATIYFFILAVGDVPLNVPTLIFAVVYALLGIVSVFYGLLVYNYASVVYITVLGGAIGTIIPFLYELLFTDIVFSSAKITSVIFRIAAMSVILLFTDDKRISIKGVWVCILSGVINGLAGVLVRMYARYPGVMSDGSLFFWTNVFTLPMIFINILRKNNIKAFISDFSRIKGHNYMYALGGMLVNNATTFVSIEIMRHISGTVYSVINGSVHLLASAFISAVVYKEDVSAQTYISVALSVVAVILSLV